MSLESDLPVVSDDTWLNDMAYRLLGTEQICSMMDCDTKQKGTRQRTIQTRTRRKFAVLDELAFQDPYRPGLDWLDAVTLSGNLGIRFRGTFLGDVHDLVCFGLVTSRWTLSDLSDARTLSMSVARVREAVLKHPKIARNGSVSTVCRMCGMSESQLMGVVERSPFVHYELSLTPAGHRLVSNE